MPPYCSRAAYTSAPYFNLEVRVKLHSSVLLHAKIQKIVHGASLVLFLRRSGLENFWCCLCRSF